MRGQPERHAPWKERWAPESRPLLGSRWTDREKEAGKVVRGQPEVTDPGDAGRRRGEQREEDIKINNRENFLELKDRNAQTETVPGNLAEGMEGTHTKLVFTNGQNTGQKAGPGNFQKKSEHAAAQK